MGSTSSALAPAASRSDVQRADQRAVRCVDPVLTLAAGLVSVLIATWAMGLAFSDLWVPWGDGDLLAVYAHAENLARGHWYFVNPDLGYPGFQDHGHFPVTDVLSFVQIWLVTQVISSPVAAVNLFNLGTYFTVAALSYLVFRWESVGRPFAMVTAVAFSVLPWHFVRSGGHVFLANYVSVPLAMFLVSLAAHRRLERPRGRWLFPTAVLAAIVLGANGVYFSLMATLLLCAVLAISSVWPRVSLPGWRTVLVAALVPATTMCAALMNRMWISTESFGETVVRSPDGAYVYGGNLVTILHPSAGTLSGRVLSHFLDLSFPNNGTFEGDALLSSAGVIAVLLTCAVAALRWASPAAPTPRSVLGRTSFWPGLFLLTIAFFATGGLGALFSFWVSSDIRAWGRFSIFVVGIAFLVAGLVLTVWRVGGRVQRIAATILGLTMAVSAVADLGAGGQRMRLEWGRALKQELVAYTAAVEQHTPDGCPVLELPLTPFPEAGPLNRMTDYSHLWPYVFSRDLRWSYGAIKGTELGDWGMDVKDDPRALLKRAREAGFCGIQVDTWAYANLAELVDEDTALGEPEIVSSSGRWAFFDLTGPLTGESSVSPGSGFTLAVQNASLPVTWWMVEKQAKLLVEGTPGEKVSVDLVLSSPTCAPATVSIGGSEVEVTGTEVHAAHVSLDADGHGSITITAASPACQVDGEAAPVLLGLAGPQWAPVGTAPRG